MKKRNYRAFIEKIKEKLPRNYRLQRYGTVKEKKKYTLYKIQPHKLSRKKILLITTGFHGEEPAGPFTIQDKIAAIINHAIERDVQLIIYPCINPSGWEHNKRYNLSSEGPNNYFLYYQLESKKFSPEVPYRAKFERYIEIDKTKLKKQMPKESILLIKDLKKVLINKRLNAILDIHQDDETPKNTHYVIITGKKRKVYRKIMKKIEKYAKILKNSPLNPSCKNVYGIKSPKELQKKIQKAYQLDKHGIITIHDGTVTDFLYRKGTKHAITIETDIKMSPKTAQKINLLWIKELIDLIAREREIPLLFLPLSIRRQPSLFNHNQ